MTILDISHGGAQIETPFPLQLDSLHDFRLSLGDRSVVVKGRIAHSQVGELQENGIGRLPDRRRVHRAVRPRPVGDQRFRRRARGSSRRTSRRSSTRSSPNSVLQCRSTMLDASPSHLSISRRFGGRAT